MKTKQSVYLITMLFIKRNILVIRSKELLLLFGVIFIYLAVPAQGQSIYTTQTGKMHLYSASPSSDFNTLNKKATALLNIQNGELAVSIDTKKFKFKKFTDQQDFDHKYFEIDNYPKITFKGNIGDVTKFDFVKSDTYPIKAKGEMMIHGITKHVEIKGTLKKMARNYQIQGQFIVFIDDYKIIIPKEVLGTTKEIIQADIFFDLAPKTNTGKL